MISYGPPRLRALASAAVFSLHNVIPKTETAPVAWYDPRRHFIGWTLFGCACLGIIALAFQWFRPSPAIQVSSQTTFLAAPLRSDGLPDFHLAKRLRQGHGIAPDENAAVPFWQAMGRPDFDADHWVALCRELQMQPADDDDGLNELEEQSRHAVEAWLENRHPSNTSINWESAAYEIISRCQESPWHASECPALAELIAHHAANYDRLYEAVERQTFYSPSAIALADKSRIDIALELTTSLRAMVRSLVQRACLRMGGGNLQGAWNDLQVGLRLCTLPHQDTNVEVLVQIACEGVLLEPLKHLLNDPQLTPSLAQKIHQTLRRLPEHISQLRAARHGERLSSIQHVILTSKNPAMLAEDQFTHSSARGLSHGAIDWNVTLKKINLAHDELSTILSIDDPATRQQRLKSWEDRLNQDYQQLDLRWNRFIGYLHPGKRSRIIANGMVGSSISSYSMILTVVEQAAVIRELVTVAAQLAAYRLQSGVLPENLVDVVPDVFAKQPIDPIYGTPIRYRRLSDANILLYGVGPNGRDDNGSNSLQMVYRGLSLYRFESERLRQVLKDEGDPAPPVDLNVPLSSIPEGADDVGWRTLPQLDSLTEVIDHLVAKYTADVPLEDSHP